MSQVIEILRLVLNVHIAGVPVAEHGDTLWSPVTPDAEFGVAKSGGTLKLAQRVKSRFKTLHNIIPFLIAGISNYNTLQKKDLRYSIPF